MTLVRPADRCVIERIPGSARSIAVLLGAEFNAELERGRAIAGGHPPGTESFTELRDTRKLRNTTLRTPAA